MTKRVKPLTYNEWLQRNCGFSESKFTKEYLISIGYFEDLEIESEEDIEDYIEGKRHEYNNYLKSISE